MAYKLKADKKVADALKELDRTNRRLCIELSRLLLSLTKNPYPPGSHELRPFPIVPIISGSRVWAYQRFEIVYQVDRRRNRVVVSRVIVH